MDSPVAPDQLWIDNDPRASDTRYLLVLEIQDGPHQSGKVLCRTWYDRPEGREFARATKISPDRFLPTSTGAWARTGYRPADTEPQYGRPTA